MSISRKWAFYRIEVSVSHQIEQERAGNGIFGCIFDAILFNQNSGCTTVSKGSMKKFIIWFASLCGLISIGIGRDLVNSRRLWFWREIHNWRSSIAEFKMLRPGFEPGSRDWEPLMLGRATPPEHCRGIKINNLFLSLRIGRRRIHGSGWIPFCFHLS